MTVIVEAGILMKAHSPERTGLLVVRLWIEANAHEGFRARITQTLDSGGAEKTMDVAASPEGVYSVVRAWVEDFVETEINPAGDVTVT